MAVFIKFWGTRGSIPTPASWTRIYGGNTPCVEIRFGDNVFICDAGSGVRELGKDIVQRQSRPKELHLFITHTHWDHIQGFPFFVPAYLRNMQINVYGRAGADNGPHHLLSGQMKSEYFPVSFADLGAQIVPRELNLQGDEINGAKVRCFPLNHPGGCIGYVFEIDGRKIVYATDNELEIQPGDKFPDLTNDGPLRRVPQDLISVARDADILIADAQYDEKEYVARRGWGHSSCLSVVDFALQARVRNLALFHHDPECADAQLEEKVRFCIERVTKHHSRMVVFAAREGVELKF